MQALVIDDSKGMRMILCKILKRMGFETMEAGDGHIGFESLEANPELDIVLVDWNMPTVNGLEFVRKVRESPTLSPVPILVVSSESDPRYVDKIKSAGANGYIEKPFTPEQILEQLRTLGVASKNDSI